MDEFPDKTRIDLGEDLLEKTATHPHAAGAPPALESFDLSDAIHSAKILISEGIWEEAKKVLRKVLVAESHHIEARTLLHDIHDRELQQLMTEETPRRYRDAQPAREHIDAEQIIKDLDRDLELGLLDNEYSTLFSDEVAMHEYSKQLEKATKGSSVQDRIDLGIGFLEMGLLDIAILQLDEARLQAERRIETQREQYIAAINLGALARIRKKQEFDAISLLESVTVLAEIPDVEKIESFYLLGTAYTRIGKQVQAKAWFARVSQIDPKYRSYIRL